MAEQKWLASVGGDPEKLVAGLPGPLRRVLDESPGRIEELDALFSSLDHHGIGSVRGHDLARAMRLHNVDREVRNRVLEIVDANRDGQVSFAEFVAIAVQTDALSLGGAAPPPRPPDELLGEVEEEARRTGMRRNM